MNLLNNLVFYYSLNYYLFTLFCLCLSLELYFIREPVAGFSSRGWEQVELKVPRKYMVLD